MYELVLYEPLVLILLIINTHAQTSLPTRTTGLVLQDCSPAWNLKTLQLATVDTNNLIMDVDNGDVEEKKRKREAYVTSGCGYGQSKKRILHAFDNALWPILANGGWTKVRAWVCMVLRILVLFMLV